MYSTCNHSTCIIISDNGLIYAVATFSLIFLLFSLSLQDKPDSQAQALVVIKFLEQVYTCLPSFKSSLSTSQDFIESLAATLFPPNNLMTVEEEEGGGEDTEEDVSTRACIY